MSLFSVSGPDKIIDGLFIGSGSAAANESLLLEHGITHVLTVQAWTWPKFPGKFTYLVVDALDIDTYDLRAHFDKTNAFIAAAIASSGTVFVHCGAGISRSSTVCIAYLMWKERLAYEQARALVAASRPLIEPNDGFVEQLLAYERELGVLVLSE